MRVSFPCVHLTHLLELSRTSVQCPRGLVPGHGSEGVASILNTCSKPLGKPLGLGDLGDQQGLGRPSPAERSVLKKHTEAKSCSHVSFGQRARGPVDPARVDPWVSLGGWDGL